MQTTRIYTYYFILLMLLTSAKISADEKNYKILYVDSYNQNAWSSAIDHGIHSVLDEHKNITLKTFRMDTKRNTSIDFKKNAALKAKKIIDEWRPDLVITSDDNAAKYLIMPYFINSDIPFVFCGINYDASIYGFPAKNITGMIEVYLIDQTMEIMKPYAKGERIGFLSCDNLTAHKTYNYLKNAKYNFTEVVMVNNFDQLKKAFIDIQQKIDILYLWDPYSVKDFNLSEMIEFAKKHTVIPTSGATYSTMKFALVGTPTVGIEHGEWAAKTALDILNGKSPDDIPITKNKQTKIFINLSIAKKLGIKFPAELIESSYLIYDKPTKVLFLSYYNSNCTYINDIEKGILNSLNLLKIKENEFDNSESEVEFTTFKKNISKNTTIVTSQKLAKQGVDFINKFKPDVIIATYDKTLEYLLNDPLSKLTTPFIICGINSKISLYNSNTNFDNINYDPKLLSKVLNFAEEFAQGKKIGYIGKKAISSQRTIKILETKLNINFDDGYFVSTFQELKNKFLKLQNNVDIVFFVNFCDIDNFNKTQADNFFHNNTKIPTINLNTKQLNYALLGLKQFTLGQGWLAGKMALQVASGDDTPSTISPGKNISNIYINKALADKLKIIIPPDILTDLIIVDF